MKRTFLKVTAVAGVASLAMLAAGPAIAATEPVSQASAQSLKVSIAGTPAVSQLTTATNDGTAETANNPSTLPNLANILPATNLTGLGVAPQEAHAKADGTSYACAGVAGTGSGILEVGTKGCDIKDGEPVTIGLGNLDLGQIGIDPDTTLGGLGVVVTPIVKLVQDSLISALSGAINGTPLDIKLGGTLSAISASCVADPTSASGTARLAGSALTAEIAGQTLNLVTLPADPKPNQEITTDLSGVTQVVIDDVKAELTNLLSGPLSPLAPVADQLGGLLQTVQDQLIANVVAQLKPLTDALDSYVLSGTLNKQVVGDNGRSIDVTALTLDVLPAVKQFTGSALLNGTIGHVNCGPNAGPAKTSTPTPTPTDTPTPGDVPTGIDSGSNGSNTGAIIAAMSVLLAAGGAAGAGAYRRYWMPRG